MSGYLSRDHINQFGRNRTRSRIARIAIVILLTVFLTACSERVVLTTGFSDDIVFRIGTEEMNLAQMQIHFLSLQREYEAIYGETIWDEEDGPELSALVRENALSRASRIKVLDLLAGEKGIELSEEETSLASSAAEEYLAKLDETDYVFLGCSEDTPYREKREQERTDEAIRQMFADYALAVKTYDSILSSVNPEVSDDEARIVRAEMIQIHNAVKVLEAKSLLDGGTDFDSVAARYNEGDALLQRIGRGERDQAIEDVVFTLPVGEISGIVEAEGSYYLIRVVSNLDREETDQNKLRIIQERRQQAFETEYEEFSKGLEVVLNEENYDRVVLCRDSAVRAGGFYEICRQYFGTAE